MSILPVLETRGLSSWLVDSCPLTVSYVGGESEGKSTVHLGVRASTYKCRKGTVQSIFWFSFNSFSSSIDLKLKDITTHNKEELI